MTNNTVPMPMPNADGMACYGMAMVRDAEVRALARLGVRYGQTNVKKFYNSSVRHLSLQPLRAPAISRLGSVFETDRRMFKKKFTIRLSVIYPYNHSAHPRSLASDR